MDKVLALKKVSVIVPIFNGAEFVERCTKSILDQSYQDIELILVDDGSEDNSLELCHEIAQRDNRVKVLSQSNKGVSSARNKGLSCASGEFFTFVDVDDCLLPGMLDMAINYLNQTEADVVTYGWNRYMEQDGSIQHVHETYEIISGCQTVIQRMLEHYSAYGGGYPWNKIWRKSEHLKAQPFDESLFYFEDMEWVVRMMLQINKIVVCPECLYQYSVRKGSVTTDLTRNEEKEISYHMALKQIIHALSVLTNVQHWLEEKYAPEIVNGIVHAKRRNWTKLEKYLKEQLHSEKDLIMKSPHIPAKTKLRCLKLSLFN